MHIPFLCAPGGRRRWQILYVYTKYTKFNGINNTAT